MDYQIITVPSYDGRGGKTKAIEVFNTVTGAPICFCRCRPFEAKAAWIARALADAERAAA